MKFKRLYIALIIFSCCFVNGCKSETPVSFSGKTMGTVWNVTISDDEKKIPVNLGSQIEMRLEEINKSMSLFYLRSELSHFNETKKAGAEVCVSDDFIKVYKLTRYLYKITEGAWDGTIGPLVNLWGFGNEKLHDKIPDNNEISEKLKNIGFDSITLRENRCLVKNNPNIILDFGSVAKGYGVDVIAELLRDRGINNFLIEIGGEVFASGFKKGVKWKIGVKTPEKIIGSKKIYNVVELENRAIATSGDYRNFREINGVLYSHIINPKTGWPVKNNVTSVSVTAETTALADGLATALMVMGYEKGIKLVDSIENVECLIITREANDFISHVSKGWK